jgi:hypothetical protein
VILDKITLSFKYGMYPVSTAFTGSTLLLANTSECKARAEKTKVYDDDRAWKHTCVHCLPVLYKLTILLIDEPGEHALVEFTSCFTRHSESLLDEVQSATAKASNLLLMDASGFNTSESSLPATVCELLEAVTPVGTERGKDALPLPPDPMKLDHCATISGHLQRKRQKHY